MKCKFRTRNPRQVNSAYMQLSLNIETNQKFTYINETNFHKKNNNKNNKVYIPNIKKTQGNLSLQLHNITISPNILRKIENVRRTSTMRSQHNTTIINCSVPLSKLDVYKSKLPQLRKSLEESSFNQKNPKLPKLSFINLKEQNFKKIGKITPTKINLKPEKLFDKVALSNEGFFKLKQKMIHRILQNKSQNKNHHQFLKKSQSPMNNNQKNGSMEITEEKILQQWEKTIHQPKSDYISENPNVHTKRLFNNEKLFSIIDNNNSIN